MNRSKKNVPLRPKKKITNTDECKTKRVDDQRWRKNKLSYLERIDMIRAMQISDASRAAEIHVFGWRSAYRGIISDDFLFNKMIVSKRVSYFENSVRNQAEESYVFDDGIIKAILTIGDCRDADKANSFELWGIYVV